MIDELLFFDNDCISAFLWIDDTSIVTNLYGQRIVIPAQVYNELAACQGVARILKTRIDLMISNNDATLIDMETGSKEYSVYAELALNPPEGARIIGKGEAACIALAKERKGILASNNLKDIQKYIEKYQLKHITTADIMVEAYDKEIISKTQAEQIWADMMAKRRRLGTDTFSEYLYLIGR